MVNRLDSLKVGRHKIIVSYGEPLSKSSLPKGCFQINIAQFDYEAFLKKNEEPSPKFLINDNSNQSIPYLFSNAYLSLNEELWKDEETGHVLISSKKNHISCDVDLISTAFYLLTLENETIINKRDSHNRFLRKFASNSEPIYNFGAVDSYCFLLTSFLRKAAHAQKIPLIHKALWPENYQFALCLTHDIDRLNTWTFTKVKSYIISLFQRGLVNPLLLIYRLLKLVFSLFNWESWLGNFEMILKIEKRYGFNSSFYFVAGKHHELDPVYDLNSRTMQNRFKYLKEHETEIGLHGSFQSSEEYGYLKTEKQVLTELTNQEPVGGRQHFLRFTKPQTLLNIEEAGLAYDSTLGFSDAFGFRCGISFPFRPYNTETEKPYSFYEFPLHIMESAIQKNANYRFLHKNNIEPIWKEVQVLLRQIKSFDGCVNVLWHNSDFDRFDISWYAKFYENILHWVYANNGWGCSGRELLSWWKKRAESKINTVLVNGHEFQINLQQIESDDFSIIIDPPKDWPNCNIEYEECTGQFEVRDGKVYVTLKDIVAGKAKIRLAIEKN